MEKVDTKTWFDEFGREIEESDIRCEALKSQLSYMKNLYQGFPSEPTESLKSQDYSPRLSQSFVKSQSSHGSNDFKEFLIKENNQMQSYMSDIHKMKCMINETIAETPRTNRERSIKSPRISSEKINSDFSNDGREESNKKSCDFEEESPRTMILSSRIKKNESFRDRASNDKIVQNNLVRNSEQDCYSEISTSFRRHLIEIPTSAEKQEEQIVDTPEIQNKPKKEELVLNLSRSIESTQTHKNKQLSKSEKKYYRKGIVNKTLTNRWKSNGKIEESIITIAKVRKKKGRLRSVNSRSTIATRDTSLSERKDSRRKKRKSFLQKNSNSQILDSQSVTSYRQRIPEATLGKPQQNWSDVVELYHNMAVKSGSLSVVSSKHSRLDPPIQDFLHGTPSANNCNKKLESRQQQIKKPDKREKWKNLDTFEEESISNGTVKQNYKEDHLAENDDSGTIPYLQSYPGSKFYDPMVVRNYEQPTVSSKLKRVQRSYFNRFNFRNIPFIVGTSISPSHNLGLNIQQVLSIMKAKQSRPNGITPMLIRKVSQGTRPMTSLLSQMSSRNGFPNFDNNERLKEPLNYQTKTTQSVSTNRMSNFEQNYSTMHQTYSSRNTCETLFEEKEENESIEQKHNFDTKQCPSLNNKIIKGKKFNGQAQISQCTLSKRKQMELNMGDYNLSSYQSASNSAKENRDVLLKLHDQFEEMNTRYERLQEKAEKCKDKSLNKELEKLERELTAKEEEIRAVVCLYKEVMVLKKQMKMMAERNSFVCISTESSNPCPIINHAHAPIIRPQTAPHFKMSKCEGTTIGSIREPSTGTRLTGLLRQIQMFQRQLNQAT